ncbi:MAG: A/G-specific adenine glycosylase [Deltaproteobacteria bacterium]
MNSPGFPSSKLLAWYRRHKRDLPWRRTRDPYRIWVSEAMLQQTTVATVIPYYRRWLKRFPSMRRLAAASLPDVLKAWQGLGYYQRARNVHKAARLFCGRFEGRIPDDPHVLAEVPGFGPYTTAAVLSIAFDRPLTLIDANVRRVMARYLVLKDAQGKGADKAIQSCLDKALPRGEAGDFNQALMELGALVCRKENPLCPACPLKTRCGAWRQDLQDVIPGTPERQVEFIEAAAAVVERGDRVFLQQRGPKGLLAGLWEFPGGKIEKAETPEAALRRELREELGVSLPQAKLFMTVRHAYTRFRVRLHVYRCSADPLPGADRTHRWVPVGRLKEYPVPSATARIIEALTEKGASRIEDR